jgi:thioredoxin-related protein
MLPARAGELASVDDFTAVGQAAQAKQVPILVLFMSPHCPYCDRVLREFLVPMQRNAEYRSKVLMRQIDIDSSARLRDFSGKMTTQREFARGNRIHLTPTIKLFDARGRELTSPIIGLLTPDFYGGVLDTAIDGALTKVRAGPDGTGR